MTHGSRERRPDALESHLDLLRTDIVFPRTPDIAPALHPWDSPGVSLNASAKSGRILRPPWKALAFAAVLLGIIGFAIPGSRSTVANWFDFDGIRIEIGTRDDDPRTPPASLGGSILFGERVSTDEAALAVPFGIVALSDQRTGETPETFLLQRDGAVIVSLLYPSSPELPEIGATGVGLLLMQIDSPEPTGILVKRSMNEQQPVSVDVNGNVGAWIAGGTLTVEPVYESGTFERSSGNVLIWEQDGVTYRMESSLSLNDALAVARSLQPLSPAEPTS